MNYQPSSFANGWTPHLRTGNEQCTILFTRKLRSLRVPYPWRYIRSADRQSFEVRDNVCTVARFRDTCGHACAL